MNQRCNVKRFGKVEVPFLTNFVHEQQIQLFRTKKMCTKNSSKSLSGEVGLSYEVSGLCNSSTHVGIETL